MTLFTSLSATPSSLRKPRLRFDDFFSRLWLFIACRRRIFPDPVTRNLFFAPDDVFIFGIGLHSHVLQWRQNHDHVAAVEDRLLLDRSELLRNLHRMAVESPFVTATCIEATEFPELSRRYRVTGVPKTVAGETEIVGALPEEDFVAGLLKGSAPEA